MTRALPEPMEELNRQFWAHCAAERLCFQRCSACGVWRHLPRPMCAACGSMDWQWQQASGRGTVYSWTVTRAPLHPAFAALVPFAVLIVELEEGVKMLAGFCHHSLDDIKLGMPVEVVFERLTESIAMPYFQPCLAASSAS